MTDTHPLPIAAILAGGQSTRMGGEHKGFLPFPSPPQYLLDHIIDRITPQSSACIINIDPQIDTLATLANRHKIKTLVPDKQPMQAGPLAGIAACLSWCNQTASSLPLHSHLLVVPCDTPFIPLDLTEVLHRNICHSNQIVIAQSLEQKHFTVGLWPLHLAEPIEQYLSQGNRSIKGFLASQSVTYVPFSATSVDPFFNINTPQDYQLALTTYANEN